MEPYFPAAEGYQWSNISAQEYFDKLKITKAAQKFEKVIPSVLEQKTLRGEEEGMYKRIAKEKGCSHYSVRIQINSRGA